MLTNFDRFFFVQLNMDLQKIMSYVLFEFVSAGSISLMTCPGQVGLQYHTKLNSEVQNLIQTEI